MFRELRRSDPTGSHQRWQRLYNDWIKNAFIADSLSPGHATCSAYGCHQQTYLLSSLVLLSMPVNVATQCGIVCVHTHEFLLYRYLHIWHETCHKMQLLQSMYFKFWYSCQMHFIYVVEHEWLTFYSKLQCFYTYLVVITQIIKQFFSQVHYANKHNLHDSSQNQLRSRK